MDLITYYAKFGPKVSRSNGDPSSQKSSSSDATSSQQASVPTVPIIPVHNGRRPDYGFDDTLDSDVEEDDTQEVPHQELLLFIHQMRSPTLAMKAQVTLFNKTHRVVSFCYSFVTHIDVEKECDGCMNRNIECRVTESSQRCQLCTTKRRQCSRTEVLYQWMVRHKFKLSWKKAEEVLKHGQFLARTTKSVKPPKTEAEEQTNVLATSTTVEVRTSPRTPSNSTRLLSSMALLTFCVSCSSARQERARRNCRAHRQSGSRTIWVEKACPVVRLAACGSQTAQGSCASGPRAHVGTRTRTSAGGGT